MKTSSLALSLSIAMLIFFGCASPQQNTINNKDTVTLGTVQKDIKVGVSKSEVLQALGSPNIVTNEQEKEIWVYDKISTETNESKVGVSAGGAGSGSSAAGFLGVSGSKTSTRTSQKTLTVIIKFDVNNQVEKVSYHSSKY